MPEIQSDAAHAGPGILQVIRRRHWLLWLFAAVGLGLSYLYYSRQPPVFQSDAQILVTHRAPQVTGERASAPPSSFIEDQMLVLRTPALAASAVERVGLGAFPRYRDSHSAAAGILGGLSVSSPKDTSFINLSYRGSEPGECEAVLKALLGAARDRLNKSQMDSNRETTTLIARAKDDLLAELSKAKEAYQKFRENAPEAWVGAGADVHSQRMAGFEAERAQLEIDQANLRVERDVFRDALARGGNREALLVAAERASRMKGSSPTVDDAVSSAQELFPLLLEMELLSEQLGRDHPKVRALSKRINLTRNFFGGGAGGKDRPDFVTVYLQSLEQQMELNEERKAELDKQFAAEQEGARKLGAFKLKDEQYQTEIKSLQDLFDTVVSRLKQLSLVDGFESVRLDIVSPPGPGRLVRHRLIQALAFGGILGLLVGFAGAYALEAADKSFRSPHEIRGELGVPVVGHVPVIPLAEIRRGSPDSIYDPSLVTVHRPGSRFADSYRDVRTALFFSNRNASHKVVQVTSADVGDGKSTLASNLAISIAQSGRRTLLVDADIRRPRMATLFGLPHVEAGLADVVRGDCDPADAAVATGVDRLWLLPSDICTAKDVELFASDRFDELLDLLREQYDYVVIDSPPLLAAPDPVNIAARADGVLIAMRLDGRARDKSGEVFELLDRVGASALGIVVNGVTRNDYSGGSYSWYGSRYGEVYAELPAARRSAALVNGTR